MVKFRFGKSIETQLREQGFSRDSYFKIGDEDTLCAEVKKGFWNGYLPDFSTELYIRQVDRIDEKYELWVRRERKE